MPNDETNSPELPSSPANTRVSSGRWWLIGGLLHEGGLAKMHQFVSETAQYGDLTRGPRVVNDETRSRMREVLAEIRDGTFAREWVGEYAAGNGNYKAMKERDLAHPIEQIGAQLRSRMPWLVGA